MTNEYDTWHFGNNFYALFEGRRISVVSPENWFVIVYLQPLIEQYEQFWNKFLTDHHDLVSAIDSALVILQEIFEDGEKVRSLLEKGKFVEAGTLEEELELPFRRYQVWMQLSPLLIEAARLMEMMGIDSPSIGEWTLKDTATFAAYKNQLIE